MRVGFLGLGRLGLPIAAILSQHHRVTGYDPDPSTAERLKTGHPWETGLGEFLNDRIALAGSVDAATFDADVVVVCVQTPHDPELDGTRETDRRAPFDLSYVESALDEIKTTAPVVLMSTVLPGDSRKLAKRILGPLVYSPAFPAMGTTVSDVLRPEFVLMGIDIYGNATATELLAPIHINSPAYIVDSYETIELAKMAYNTAIGAKIALANTVGWLAEETGGDGGRVMEILSLAHRRITSPAYLRPGLGDGGACHPRDQIALSWLARQHDVYDLFGNLMDHRSAHSAWVAQVAVDRAEGRQIVILGAAYKADSTLTDGSAALLMANQTGWPVVESPPSEPSCIVIGAPHTAYKTLDLSQHIVIDPWGIVPDAIYPGRAQLR